MANPNPTPLHDAHARPGDAAPEPGPTSAEICPVCKGTGQVSGHPCRDCGGTGRVTRTAGDG